MLLSFFICLEVLLVYVASYMASSSVVLGSFSHWIPTLMGWCTMFSVPWAKPVHRHASLWDENPEEQPLGWKARIRQKGEKSFTGSPNPPQAENPISVKKHLPEGKMLSTACLRCAKAPKEEKRETVYSGRRPPTWGPCQPGPKVQQPTFTVTLSRAPLRHCPTALPACSQSLCHLICLLSSNLISFTSL